MHDLKLPLLSIGVTLNHAFCNLYRPWFVGMFSMFCNHKMHEMQLIFRKIIKIVATRCQILRLKCTKFDFGWGSAADHAGGAYSAPTETL